MQLSLSAKSHAGAKGLNASWLGRPRRPSGRSGAVAGGWPPVLGLCCLVVLEGAGGGVGGCQTQRWRGGGSKSRPRCTNGVGLTDAWGAVTGLSNWQLPTREGEAEAPRATYDLAVSGHSAETDLDTRARELMHLRCGRHAVRHARWEALVSCLSLGCALCLGCA